MTNPLPHSEPSERGILSAALSSGTVADEILEQVTPETDAKASDIIGFFSCATVPADFARKLERERDEAMEALSGRTVSCAACNHAAIERDEAREEAKRLQELCVSVHDRLLRGASDCYLLAMLEESWKKIARHERHEARARLEIITPSKNNPVAEYFSSPNTPETDAQVTTFSSISKFKKRFLCSTGKVSAQFARKLERERNEAREDATNYFAKIGELESERDEAIAEYQRVYKELDALKKMAK